MLFHVDMDAFFAAVEVRDDPSLAGKPVLVGGTGGRGVVAAASYEARRFGCRSAMPMAKALRLCPQAIVLPPRFEAYAEASARAFAVFDRFSPIVEGLSIDEAFLDMQGSERLLGPPRMAAEALRAAVRVETGGLTCSVGISRVKFLAKIASAMNKPDGLTLIEPGREREFLHPLPIARLWGVGPKTAARLREHGITTVGELAGVGQATLARWFGEHGLHLHDLSHAIDPRVVESGRERKSVSHEDTFEVDLVGRPALLRQLLSQATRVADRLVAKGLCAGTVHLKIRDRTFHTETRQCTLPTPTQQASVIHAAAARLLDTVSLEGRSFRLTGVGVSDLRELERREAVQLELLAPAPTDAKGNALQRVMTRVRHRYGHHALFPADAGPRERPNATGALSKTRDGAW